MSFFGSELGVAVAWICTVAGFLFSILMAGQNKKLKMQLTIEQNTNQALTNQIGELTAGNADLSTNEVGQNGKKNIYIKQQAGGLKINM